MRTRLAIIGALVVLLLGGSAAAGAPEEGREPSLLVGFGKVVGGLFFELPKTVIQTALDGPRGAEVPMGLFAGAVRAARVTADGFREMHEAFDPWGMKRQDRRRTPSGWRLP